MRKLKGGVGIINVKDDPSLEALKGDIMSFEHGLYSVKLRGTTDTVVHLPKQNLVKLKDDSESLRSSLLKAAESQPAAIHLQRRLLVLRLEEEFSYLVKRHTNRIGWDPLPDEIGNEALVRYMQAYCIGRGCILTEGRQLTSFHLVLSPFYSHFGGGRFSTPLNGGTTGDMFQWCQQQFEQSDVLNPLLVIKAFAFVQHRLDFCQQEDSLLDAFCVSMYMINFLQSHDDNGRIQDLFQQYGSHEVPPLDTKQALWCFCRVFLNLAFRVRDMLDEQLYNVLFPDPYGFTIEEQAKIAQLIVDLRPACPASQLVAYVSYMDTKDFFLNADSKGAFQKLSMEAAFKLVTSGKEVADRDGDPLYQYVFHMIAASWLPTTTCKTPCTVGEISERMRRANDYMNECESYVPAFLFFQGKQCEYVCKAVIEEFQAPGDMVLPKIDAYVYSSVRFGDNKYYEPGGKYDRLAKRYRCANCSRQLLKTRKCARCGKVFYCSKECQVNHWKNGGNGGHREECVPTKDDGTSKS